ncbi:Arc-like DNA binding dprotein [Comamonas sp. BIGb0124]|uniref:Arc family DNA-binding protein n=1 Tax=Comamonas sp. BIGb0124 TaxID=2485130 RepID=UPI000F4ACECA|nr:Arc family DNA-binding protein [Comamonas sp. BIGb0124]ROR21728.1 Arc-like DNA binding dprotein [Comamonas sp. BIGb0124]
MKQTDPQYKLRFPPELKEWVEAAASESGRSMNAEIVRRLQDSFKTQPRAGRSRMRGERLEEFGSPQEVHQKLLENAEEIQQLVGVLRLMESEKEVPVRQVENSPKSAIGNKRVGGPR